MSAQEEKKAEVLAILARAGQAFERTCNKLQVGKLTLQEAINVARSHAEQALDELAEHYEIQRS